MRNITDHIVEGDTAPQLTIKVLDDPGAGGANHKYSIMWDVDARRGDIHVLEAGWQFSFQNGPIKENGINGVTQEALLAIVIDRLQSFQAGPFPSEFNKLALEHAKLALMWLQARTKERIARGVEGKTIA